MAGELSAGRAYVEVVPSLKDFHKKNAAEMRKAGAEARRAFDEGFASGKRPDAPTPDTKQYRAKGKESGQEFAGAFDREVRSKITAALKSLPDAEIGADSSEAEREVAKVRASLERLSKQRIGIDVDEATALNRLESLQRKLQEIGANDTASIGVKADTTQAALELDKIRVSAERVGALSPTVTVDADTAGAQAQLAGLSTSSVAASTGVSGLVAAGLLLGPAIIPGAAAATSALVMLGGAGGAAAAGIGVTALALGGIPDAIKATVAAEDAATKDSEAAATRRVAATRQVESAQESLKQAQQSQSDQAVRSARAVEDAQKGVVSAMRGVQDAERGVADARRSASDGVRAALERVRSAEDAQTQAARAAKSAQDALNNARVDAKRALQDMQAQLRDGELSERQAVLSLARARQALGKKHKSPLDFEQSQLDYDQAKANLEDIRRRNARLAADKKKADREGVNGSARVQSAQQALIDAQARQKKAGEDVAKAEQDVTRAREDGARRIAAAQRQVADAQVRVADAQAKVIDAQAQQGTSAKRSAEQVASAQKRLEQAHQGAEAAANKSSAAQTKAAEAMAGLSPAGRKFAKFILGLRGGLSELQGDAAKGLLPGLQSGMESAGKALSPMRDLVGSLAKDMGDMASSAGKGLAGPEFQSFFSMVEKQAGPTMETLGRILGNMAKAFAGLATAFSPISQQVLGGLEGLTERFAAFANEGEGGGLSRFIDYLREQGPKVAEMIGAVAKALGRIIVAMAPFGQWVVKAITDFSNQITKMPIGTLRALLGAIIGVTLAWKAAAAAARAANAVAGVTNTLKKVATIWTNREAAATTRSTIATKAKTIATKAAAVAMRLFNAVTKANPIGLLVTALVALGAGLVLAYKKSETFRRIVDAAWAGVKKAAKAVVDWWTETAWPAIKKFFTNIGSAMVKAKNKVVGAWDSIKNKVVAVKDWITKTAWPALKSTLSKLAGFIPVVAVYRNWNKITGKFKAVWNWVKGTFSRWWSGIKRILTDPIGSAKTVVTRLLGKTGLRKPILAVWTWVRDTFKKSWSGIKKIFTNPIESARTIIRRILGKFGLQKTFQNARDAMGRIWSKVTDKIKSPIGKAMKWLDKHFVSKVRGLLRKVNLGKLADSLPSLDPGKGFARGGILPGYTPISRGDDVLTPMRSGEGVLVSEGLRDPRSRSMFLAANSAAKKGVSFADFMRGGYAGGGIVHRSMAEWLKRSVPGAVVTSTTGGGHSKNSYHYQGKAIDIGGSPEIMRAAAAAIQRTFGGHLLELIHNPGFSVKNGQRVAPSFWGGTTWANHRNHVHWAMNAMGKGGFKSKLKAGLFGPANTIGGFAGKVLEGGVSTLTDIVDRMPGAKQFFGQMVASPMKSFAGGVFDKAQSAANALSDLGRESGPSGGKGVERWRGTVLKALGIMGLSPKYANSTLRRMMQESGGNPRAINNWDINARRGDPSKGLMQVIGSTFRAYAHPSYNRDIYDPLSNILASMRYAQARYGSLWAAYDRKGGYAAGGLVRPAVFDNGGTLAPGYNLVHNKLGKPEPLVRPDQFMSGPVVVNVIDRDGTFVDRMRGEIEAADKHARVLSRMGG